MAVCFTQMHEVVWVQAGRGQTTFNQDWCLPRLDSDPYVFGRVDIHLHQLLGAVMHCGV